MNSVIIKTDKNLQLIQVLRGFAALLVVLMHTGDNFKKSLGVIFLFDFFKFGGAGVDIFFVLSGFIITYTNFKNITPSNKLTAFLKRRFVRIFPTYWIIATVLLISQIIFPSFFRTLFPLEANALIDTYFLLPNHTMLNGVSWTLTYELFFYLVFTTVFFVPNRKILFGLLLTYCVLIIVGNIYTNAIVGNKWVAVILFPMNVEFFIGMLTVIIIPKLSRRSGAILVIAGLVLFLLSAILSNNGYYITNNGFNRVLLFGLPSFLLICGLVSYEKQATFKAPKLLLMLGDGSYSLYLLHLPVIAAFCKVLSTFRISNVLLLHLFSLFTIIFICYTSILFFNLIEKQIIAHLNSKRRIRIATEI